MENTQYRSKKLLGKYPLYLILSSEKMKSFFVFEKADFSIEEA